MNKVSAAILGLGRWGQTHLERSSNYFEFLSHNHEIHKNLEAVADSKAEIVFICTPHFQHDAQIEFLLERGKHVHCEPPLALSPDRYSELKSLAKKNHRQLFDGHNFDHLKILKRLEEFQFIGEITHILMEYHSQSGYRYNQNQNHWRAGLEQNPLGCFSTMGIHMVHHIQKFGEIDSYHLSKRRRDVAYDFFDDVILDGLLKSGPSFRLHTCSTSYPTFRITLNGKEGSVILIHDYIKKCSSVYSDSHRLNKIFDDDSLDQQAHYEYQVLQGEIEALDHENERLRTIEIMSSLLDHPSQALR